MGGNPVSKILIITGSFLLGAGLLIHFGGRFFDGLGLGKLPGDIAIERENFKFYFPVTTSILVSVALSLALYFINKFKS